MENKMPRYMQEMYILFLIIGRSPEDCLKHACTEKCVEIVSIKDALMFVDVHRIRDFVGKHNVL